MASLVDTRRYGQACVACRKKKRRCLPSDAGGERCMLCERDDDVCQVSRCASRSTSRTGSAEQRSKRRRTNGHTESPVRRISSSETAPGNGIERSTPQTNPAALHDRPSGYGPDTLALQSLSEASSMHDAYSHSPYHASPWTGPSTSSTADDPTPRAMYDGPRTSYDSAVSDFVERVCGPAGLDEPHETLLRTYFAWQGPQHMPVDEKLFRRESES